MTAAPAYLEKPLLGTYATSIIDTVARDSSELGKMRFRRRTTGVDYRYSFNLLLTKADVALLKTFYETTLLGGTGEFTWTCPDDAATKTVYFETLPTFTDSEFVGFRIASIELIDQ